MKKGQGNKSKSVPIPLPSPLHKIKPINTTFFVKTRTLEYDPIVKNPLKVNSKTPQNVTPACELHRTVADFYLTELKYWKLKKQRRPYWHYKYEKYYTKKFIELSETLVRFSLAALIGEARHAFKETRGWLPTNLKAQKVEKSLTLLLGSLGIMTAPKARSAINTQYIPEKLWIKFLYSLNELFSRKYSWDAGYGGVKWQKGTYYTLNLYKQMCYEDRSNVIIAFDTLINHCHNNGVMLNKFDCVPIIRALLNHKQLGMVKELKRYLDYPCRHWEKGTCYRFIGSSPLKITEGFYSE